MKKGMCFVLVLMLLMCSTLVSATTFTGFAMNEAGEQGSMDAQSTKSVPDDKTADVFEEGSESEPEKQAADDWQGTPAESETETWGADDGRTVPEPEKQEADDWQGTPAESETETREADDGRTVPEPEKQEADDAREAESDIYDPQPTKKEEVRQWIDVYTATLREQGLTAALEVKPHWQYEVAERLMPDGFHCELVDDDDDFGMDYFTFKEDELPPSVESGGNDQATDTMEGSETPAAEGEEESVEEEAVIGSNADEQTATEGSTYAPQPATMEEVWEWIGLFNTTLSENGLEAAIAVKPHWQYEVAAELMPDGYHCEPVEDDEEFGAAFYTFMESELAEDEEEDSEGPVYDPQPQTMEEVQAVIDAYEQEYLAVLEAQGFVAALEVRKPHWQYEVAAELMPAGYRCELIDYDEDFGADYYTFFPTPMPMAFGSSGYKVEPPEGPDITSLFTPIGQAVRDPDYVNVVRITEDAGDKQGIMWSTTTLDLNFPFSTKMKLYLGHKDPAPNSNDPADGVTFTMHNDERGNSAIGGFGEGLGVYRGRSAGDFSAGRHIENALVIELDTFRNDGSGNGSVTDPNIGPHCAMVIPKRGSKDADDQITINDHQNTFPFTVEQDWIPFEVSWKPKLSAGTLGGTLAYSFGGTGETYEIDNVEDIFGGTTVWWGFSGSTGGQTALQAAAITKLPSPQPDPSEPFDFSFVKVDARDGTICLEGAQFTLYACANDRAGHIHDELAVAGSCWFAGEAYHAASGEDGTVTFEGLLHGEYRLVETAAPATYQRPTGQWRVVVDILEDEIVVTGTGNPKPPAFIKTGTGENAQFFVGNVKRYVLPMTGGLGTRGYTALGSLLLMIGAAWLYFKIRQKPRKSRSTTRGERR